MKLKSLINIIAEAPILCRKCIKKTLVTALVGATAGIMPALAMPVFHHISAANITVQQNDTANTTASVTLIPTLEINDFRVTNGPTSGNSRADYFVQIGTNAADNVTNGILISSITDNGRDNGEGTGTFYGTCAIDSGPSTAGLIPGASGQWWVPVFGNAIAASPTYNEYNFDFAAAYFRYSDGWYGGWLVNKFGTNNAVIATLAYDRWIGNPKMVLGTHVLPGSGAKTVVNLLPFGLDSRANAILLCVGGKNEENYAVSQTNADGTWTVTTRDNITGAAEADPNAFVCIPLTNHMIVSGRFNGDASIAMKSAAFNVTNTSTGTYHLIIPGVFPTNGVLIISGEGGGISNNLSIVSYQAATDGWDIQTRLINTNTGPVLLQLPATDAAVSFTYIPAPTPGFTVTPTNGLNTSENGTSDHFTVVLDSPPTADVTINVASSNPNEGVASPSSLTFTSTNWNSPQTVTVTGVDDAIVDGPIAYTIVLSPAVSADSAYNGLDPADVSAVNADNDQAGITINPNLGLVTTEAGGKATFTVALNSQPSANVSIGFSSSNPSQGLVSPTTLTFTSTNWKTNQVVTITGVDDYIADGDLAYTITTAPAVSADTNYNGVKGSDVSVVNQNIDQAGVALSVSAPIRLIEGQTTNYTMVLKSKPVASVVVNLTSSNPLKGAVSPAALTFNAANWNTPQTITLTAVDNTISDGDFSYTISSAATSADTNYSGIAIPVLAGTTVDNEPPIIYPVSAANVNVVQNDTGNTTASVTVTPTLSINDMRVRPGSIRGIYNLQVGVYASDDLTNGLIMSSVTENGRDNGDGTFTYDMSAIAGSTDPTNPGYQVVMYDTTGSRARENGSFAVAYFTYASWICGWGRNSTAINGGPTDLFTGSAGVNLGSQFVSYGGGQFSLDLRSLGYNSTNDGVLIVNHGKDEGNFALSHANDNGTWSLWVKDNHGDAAAYEQDPIAFVFIPRTNNTVISGKFMSDATIAMYNGATPQFAISNVDVGTYRLTIPGYTPANGVLITSPEGGMTINQDNIINYAADGDGWLIYSRDINATALPSLETPTDTSVTPEQIQPVASFVFIPGPKPGFSVTPTNGLNTTEGGGADKFTVALTYPPTADVTINLASSKPTEGVASPASLTFTTNNWNVPQTVTVTGVDDSIVDGPITYAIVLAPAISADPAYSGLVPPSVIAVNADNDQAGVTVTPTSGLVTTEGGGSASFSVRLNSQPSADVAIGLVSSNPGEGTVLPATLTFNSTNWSSYQVVIVHGVDDFVVDGTVAYNIITEPAVSADTNYNGFKGANVSVANLDNDTAGVLLSNPGPFSLIEGQSTNYTIVLHSQPVADVLVHTVSSNPARGVPSPATLTFNASNWNVPQTVTLSAPDNFINDGDVSYTITTTVGSTDPIYAGFFIATIAVTTIDNEPTLTLPSADCLYTLGVPAALLDAEASIRDAINANYSGGTLTVGVTLNGKNGDSLEIHTNATGTSRISISDTNVYYNATAIGSFSGGANTTPLVINLNNQATPAIAQVLLRSISFRTALGNVSPVTRVVTVALNDGIGGVSVASKNVRIGLLRDMQFQDGVDYGYGVYTGENDISLAQVSHAKPQPSGTAGDGLLIDWPDGGVANESQVLLRFDDLVGTNANQIPPGAQIVSAELLLTMLNPGQGGTFNRMLIPWDATNATWDSVGGGIQKDDNQARSTYDSQLGDQIGTGTTGTGTISVGVTPDIQVWANGTNNYGWVITGWPFNTDGTGFYPSEAVDPTVRPRLHVLWLPPGEASVSLRQGVNGYTDAHDTKIQPSSPDLDASALTTLFVDYLSLTNGDTEQVLIRFDNLFGAGSNQVPAGMQIDGAVLDLASMTANAMGDGGQFYTLLMPWTDTNSTWNSWKGGVQPDGVKAATISNTKAGTPNFAALVQAGFNSFDVTADVRAWASGTVTNYGWAILPWPGGSDGWGFNTAEATVERERPQLRIFYSIPAVSAALVQPPIVSPTQVQIRFTGTVAKSYSIERESALNGSWSSIGTATVGGDGIGSFIDLAPLPGSAFYRVVYR